MNIIVAGQDRSRELGQDLRREAEALARADTSRRPAEIPPGIAALNLRNAKSESAYLDELMRLLRYRDGVSPLPYRIPVAPGLRGRLLGRVKEFFWKLLRYQHARMAFRQNLINTQLTSALEFELTARQKEVADLQKRVAALEGGGAERKSTAHHNSSSEGSDTKGAK